MKIHNLTGRNEGVQCAESSRSRHYYVMYTVNCSGKNFIRLKSDAYEQLIDDLRRLQALQRNNKTNGVSTEKSGYFIKSLLQQNLSFITRRAFYLLKTFHYTYAFVLSSIKLSKTISITINYLELVLCSETCANPRILDKVVLV